MDFWNLVSAGAAIVAIATVAGFGLQRGRVISLGEQLDEAREQIKDLKDKDVASAKKIASQSSDIDALRRVVTGEVQWEAISNLLDHHHKDSIEHWARDEKVFNEILATLRRPVT